MQGKQVKRIPLSIHSQSCCHKEGINIKPDSNCVYCGESDSIDHTFIECQLTKSFTQEVLQWFNVNNSSNFILNAEDVLFGLSSASDTLTKKLNYTLLLFLRYYICIALKTQVGLIILTDLGFFSF